MSFFSFELPKDFVASYSLKPPAWGYTDAGDNSLGEITFLRTYSRLKKDGSKEQWFEVCERVINGMYSLQKDHCLDSRLPWSDSKANESAMEAYDRMFNFKWTPPGRGLWVMGTPIVNEDRNSAALQNCAFVSTSDMPATDPAKPFAFLMEASMLGVGVGFDNKGGDLKIVINEPLKSDDSDIVIPDTREGWVDSVATLINSYLVANSLSVSFDYSVIRPEGAPIKTFGGTASGPGPLIKLHDSVRSLFDDRAGSFLSRRDIADLGNLIGVCVVSGNVRRSAELLIGSVDDEEFLNLKNYGSFNDDGSFNPGPAADRASFGWMSNNSVEVKVGQDLSPIIDRVVHNGEPGVIWMDVSRKYGRLADAPNNKDHRVAGYNPCVTSDTWVMTGEGPRQVRDLISQSFTAIVNGKPYDTISNGFWLTGADREVFDIVTDSGWSACVTGNHQVLTSRGWVEAKDLETGDQIILNDHSDGTYWNGRGEISEGYLLGHLWGDGTLKDQTAVLSIWGEHPKMMTQIESMASNFLKLRSDWKGFSKVADRGEWRLRSADLVAVARSWGMVKGYKKITNEIEKGSWEFYRGFLQGAFDTDGHVEGNLDKGVSIRLSQSDEEQLQRVQRMLGRMGILSKIRVCHQEQEQNMPGGTYTHRKSFRLIISGAQASRYMELIGFLDDAKRSKWESLTLDMTAGFYYKKPVASFVELVPAGRADVYDVTVSDVHAFDANGLYVHNCAEQSLESFEMCVSGDTKIQTRTGLFPISELVGSTVDIWNGKEWAEVRPFPTGRNSLHRVTFSDGSYLDATPKHQWSVRSGRSYKKVSTDQLKVGDILPEFSLDCVEGKRFEDAYRWGWFVGDGYVNQDRYAMAIVQEHEMAVVGNALGGRRHSTRYDHKTGNPWIPVVMNEFMTVEEARTMRKADALHPEIFTWDAQSISEFFGGWIDTDGSLIKNPNTDHYVLYGSEGKLRDAQILLRRIGINHASLRKFASKGDETNYGTRNQDLYRLLIPSYESAVLATQLKKAERFGSRYKVNNAHLNSEIDGARKQKIVSIELISQNSETFCFTEPKTGMGVFGNVLTHQCTLVETYLNRHDTLEDYKRTLKFAYLYAKTVTLLPTHWEETNAIMQRNRRIGTSMSGIANFADSNGLPVLREWMDLGYKTVEYYDTVYSEWLCVRPSIKTTTVKPSGTVSILAGESPGVHWTPGGKFFLRAIRFANSDPMLTLFKASNYRIEPAAESPETTSVVFFPVKSNALRSDNDVSIFEKMNLAATAQRYWSDNSVSVTISFDVSSESKHVPTVLHMYDGQLKTVSFLPQGDTVYAQMPYTQITKSEFSNSLGSITKVDLSPIYSGEADVLDAAGEAYCSTDYCEIPVTPGAAEFEDKPEDSNS